MIYRPLSETTAKMPTGPKGSLLPEPSLRLPHSGSMSANTLFHIAYVIATTAYFVLTYLSIFHDFPS